jgi:c-di-GMP-binding flagellar brake protein YcgR
MPVSSAAKAEMEDYRITSEVEIQSYLQQVLTARTLVTLSGPSGVSYTTMMRSAEAGPNALSFITEERNARIDALLECGEIVAVAYLDSIKLQFDLEGVVRVKDGLHSALHAHYPRVLFRFQRRSAFRVQPLPPKNAVARFPHPDMPDMQLALPVLDVSLNGVALFLPDNVPMIAAGVKIGQCLLELDEDTSMDVAMLIHHVTAINPESKGARLGCELVDLEWSDRRLQHYINQTQKRRLALLAEQR